MDFYPLSGTTTPQPDGYVPVSGVEIENKYFSDESLTSAQNAVDLGWATWGSPLDGNAADGVGGTGAYRLMFVELPNAEGAFVDNIESTVVPVPGAVVLGLLGLSAAGVRLRKRS